MRYTVPPRLAALILATAVIGGCATQKPAEGGPPGRPAVTATGRVGGALAQPLHDGNLVRTKIPDVLLQAMADPYARPGAGRCVDLVERLRPLDDALGDDLDAPSQKEEGMMDKGKTTVLTVASGAASDVIPFRGWIRKLTGAERHDRYVQAAITAGAVRRAYLKGLGEAKGCNPPATPSHELAGTPVMDQSMKPKYPIH